MTTLLYGVAEVNAQVHVTFIRAYYLQVGVMWLVAVTGLVGFGGKTHAIDYAVGYSVFLGLTLYYMRTIARRVFEGIELQFANASLAEQLRVDLQVVRLDAATDALTGQGNRRALDEILREQADIADKTGQVFSVLMLDIDFFKNINDEHRHMVGDDALRAFAQRVREHLRLGVERSALLTAPVVVVTVSVGAATLTPGHSVEDLLNAAKRGGRNQARSIANLN